jgi:MFS family permease
MSDLLRPLRQPMFARMFGATLFANVGFWAQDVTLGWLVASITNSPSLVSIVAASAMLPTFLLALPAGAIGDAVDRRAFLIITQSLVVLLVLALATTIWFDRISATVLILFALASGILIAVSGPTRQAVLPSIVGKEDLPGAVQLSSIAFNGSRAFGPMIGGLVLAAFGPVVAILSYAVGCVGVLLVFVSWRGAPPKPVQTQKLHEALVSGLRYVYGRRDLRDALLLTGIFFLIIAPLWAFAPLVARRFAAGDTRIFGMFMTCLGAGAALGGLILRPAQRQDFGPSFRNGCLFSTVALGLIAFSQHLPLTLLGFLIAGFGWIGVTAGINGFTLLTADPAYRSRVISLVLIVYAGGLSIGSLIWGQFASLTGTATAFGVGSVLMAALAVLATRFSGADGLVLSARARSENLTSI